MFHILELAGDKLKAIYGKKFTELCLELKNKWIPGCRKYIDDGSMGREPQN
jgi:hypothetical protein